MHGETIISAYNPYTNKEGKITAGCKPYNTTLADEIDNIINGKHLDIINQLREITDHQEKRAFKAANLPCFTVSVITNEWRNTQNIVNHTGLLCIDIDKEGNNHIEDFGKLRDEFFNNTKSIVAAFISSSGNGLALIIKMIPSQHNDIFNCISYELNKKGIKIDVQCKDLVRLRFTSYDKDAKIRDCEKCETMLLTTDYINNKHDECKLVYKPTNDVNDRRSFNNAIQSANEWGKFIDGQKHYHLIRVAAYCNIIGMDKENCINFVINHYSKLSDIPISALIEPIEFIYKSYKTQHATKLPPKLIYKIKHLKWLLKYIHKDLLKDYIHRLGEPTFIGESKIIIQVDSFLLAFFMYIINPTQSYTINYSSNYIPKEDIQALIPTSAYLDTCNGSRVWCDKTFNIPLNLL